MVPLENKLHKNLTMCQKVELDSALSNGSCNKNFERHVHFRELYTKQFFVELVSEQDLLVRQVVRKTTYETVLMISFFSSKRKD